MIRQRFYRWIKTILANLYELSKKRRSRILMVLSLALATFFMLGYLVYRQKDLLLNYKWDIKPVNILLAIILYSLALNLSAFNWGWLINHLGSHIKYSTHINYYLISNVSKRLPGTFWYVAGRGFFYQDFGIPYRLVTLTSGIEYILMMISAIPVSLFLSITKLASLHIKPIFLGIGFAASLFILHPKVIRFYLKSLKLEDVNINLSSLFVALLFYLISWVLVGMAYFSIIQAINNLPVQQIWYVIGSSALVGLLGLMFVALPFKMGLAEVGLSLLLSTIMPSSIAVIVSIFGRVLFTLCDIGFALVSQWSQKRKNAGITQMG